MIELVGSVVIGFFLAYLIFSFYEDMIWSYRDGSKPSAAFSAVLLGLSIWAAKAVFF